MCTRQAIAAGLVVTALVVGRATPCEAAGQGASAPAGQAAAAALLAADRAYSAQSVSTSFPTALAAMLRADVIAPGPGGLTRGADAVIAAVRAVPENLEARVEWTPVGGGVSADGQHGYTFGVMTARAPSGALTLLKYMTYWIRDGEIWKAAGYKRARRPEGEVSLELRPLRTPPPSPVIADPTRLEAQRRSLAAAERAFSDRAQVVGLGPAFVEFGAASAVNMGGPSQADFVVGNTAIGALIGSTAPGPTSPVAWASESVLVASSGDLGISFGYIKAHTPPSGTPERGQPFFTIWVRDGAGAPWRYIAE